MCTGYSAHADQNMLVSWVKSMPSPPKEIRLVHGEYKARNALAQKLKMIYQKDSLTMLPLPK